MAGLPQHGPVQRLGPAREDDQPGHRWICRGDPRGDRAAEAVPQDEDAVGVVREQLHGGQRVRHVLVVQREAPRVPQLRRMRVGDLVEAQHGHAARRQSPGDVLQRLVAPDRLVAVERTRPRQQHDARPATVRQAERAGHGQRPRAERDLLLFERAGIGVAGRLPRGDRRGRLRWRELQAAQQPVRAGRRHHREAAALAGDRDLDDDRARTGGLGQRRADRGDRPLATELGLPGRGQRIRDDQRPQLRREPFGDLGEAPGLRQLEHVQGRLRRYRYHSCERYQSWDRTAGRSAADRSPAGAACTPCSVSRLPTSPLNSHSAPSATSEAEGSTSRIVPRG